MLVFEHEGDRFALRAQKRTGYKKRLGSKQGDRRARLEKPGG